MTYFDPNPNVITGGQSRRMAKPAARAPLTKLTGAEHEYLRTWLHTHTALGRLSHTEVEAAFERLEAEADFILVKATDHV